MSDRLNDLVSSAGAEDFDFVNAMEAGSGDVSDKIATGGNLEVEPVELPKEEPPKVRTTKHVFTPELIKKARDLAGSPTGLDIEKFMKIHNISTMNVDYILHGPLDENGFLI